MGCHVLLQGIFLTQGSNPGLPHCRQTLYHLSHQGSPTKTKQCRKKNSCPFLLLESLRPLSFSRALDPFLLEGPGLLINLPKDELSQRLTSSSSLQAALETPSTLCSQSPLTQGACIFVPGCRQSAENGKWPCGSHDSGLLGDHS